MNHHKQGQERLANKLKSIFWNSLQYDSTYISVQFQFILKTLKLVRFVLKIDRIDFEC